MTSLLEDDTDDIRREGDPSDWFIADFDGECSRGRHEFDTRYPDGTATTIRADGNGGWECWECVEEDEVRVEQWETYAEATEMRGGAAYQPTPRPGRVSGVRLVSGAAGEHAPAAKETA